MMLSAIATDLSATLHLAAEDLAAADPTDSWVDRISDAEFVPGNEGAYDVNGVSGHPGVVLDQGAEASPGAGDMPHDIETVLMTVEWDGEAFTCWSSITSTDTVLAVLVDADGAITLETGPDGSAFSHTTDDDVLTPGFHVIAARKSATHVSAWVDGEQVAHEVHGEAAPTGDITGVALGSDQAYGDIVAVGLAVSDALIEAASADAIAAYAAGDTVTIAGDAAPYTDPGVTGQQPIPNSSVRTVAVDTVAPGTPPDPGRPNVAERVGERWTSLTTPEEQADLDLEEDYTG